jgi:hypothetical protein
MKQLKLLFLILFIAGSSNIALAQQGQIKGTVTDGESGQPLKSATVTGAKGVILATTGDSGEFRFAADAGEYLLYVNLSESYCETG